MSFIPKEDYLKQVAPIPGKLVLATSTLATDGAYTFSFNEKRMIWVSCCFGFTALVIATGLAFNGIDKHLDTLVMAIGKKMRWRDGRVGEWQATRGLDEIVAGQLYLVRSLAIERDNDIPIMGMIPCL